jgi:hypothetical protein
MRFGTVFLFVVVGCSGRGAVVGGPEGTPPAGDAGTGTTAFAPARAEFSAAFFVEAYCSGCHQPGYASPSGRQVSLFSTDAWWRQPFQNPDWFQTLDYKVVVEWGDAIRCGVQPLALPDGCTTLSDVATGFFSKPQKFPPPGVASSGSYGSTPPPVCAYAADGHTCPQPSDHERTEMVKWIDTGFPE